MPHTSPEIVEVSSRKNLNDFIELPYNLHKNHKQWIPNLKSDERDFFNPQKNSNFNTNQTRLIVAYQNKKPVGRCMGVIHTEHNNRTGERAVRFSFLECIEDQKILNALLRDIQDWGRKNQCTQIIGPLTFSDKDPQGFMIEGFDQNQTVATNANFPFIPNYLNDLGFEKKMDFVVYKIQIPEKVPPIYEKVFERFSRQNNGLSLLEFKSRKEVKPFIEPVFNLFNQTFKDLYGFTPVSKKEMMEFSNRYLPLIDPEFIKLVTTKNNECIAFIIGMSDISQGMKKAKGKLFPFGWWHIFRSSKKSNQLNLLLGGIHPNYQGRGLDAIMGMKMIASAKRQGKTIIDTHLELENNTKVRAEMEKMGGEIYKRYRIFQKTIS